MIVCEGSGTLRLLDYLGPPAGGCGRWLQCGGESGRGPSALLNERVLGLFAFFPASPINPAFYKEAPKRCKAKAKKTMVWVAQA